MTLLLIGKDIVLEGPGSRDALKQLGCLFFEGLGATRAGWGHLLLALQNSDVLMVGLFFRLPFFSNPDKIREVVKWVRILSSTFFFCQAKINYKTMKQQVVNLAVNFLCRPFYLPFAQIVSGDFVSREGWVYAGVGFPIGNPVDFFVPFFPFAV